MRKPVNDNLVTYDSIHFFPKSFVKQVPQSEDKAEQSFAALKIDEGVEENKEDITLNLNEEDSVVGLPEI